MTDTTTTTAWTLGMPYWDGVWDQNREDAYGTPASVWDGLRVYCDLETRNTVAHIEDEYEWSRYTWTEDGSATCTTNTDDLWWILDDTLWGPLYWSWYHDDGRQLTVAEERQSRGLPGDDLLYELEMRRIADLIKRNR